MASYRVVSDRTELTKGERFTTLPGPVEAGELALIQIGADPKRVTVGRWYPDLAGFNWFRQPGRLVKCAGEVPVKVIGRVIPCEPTPKQITNLPAGECERFFDNPFSKTLN